MTDQMAETASPLVCNHRALPKPNSVTVISKFEGHTILLFISVDPTTCITHMSVTRLGQCLIASSTVSGQLVKPMLMYKQ